jgi:S-DNA-T family DNA segregation ATPase FtsK/SpoIIIE
MLLSMMAGAAAGGLYLHRLETRDFREIRKSMKSIFKHGGLYVQLSKTKKAYPRVREIKLYRKKMKVTFTIPDGMNPEQLIKIKWMFELKLKGAVDLKQNGEWITMEAYFIPLSAYDFHFDEIKIEMEKYRDGVPIVFGRSRRGWKIVDMKKNPHLIISGLTSYGKSSLMNVMIASLMLFYKPGEIDFYFADPMSAEFTAYRNMMHTKGYEDEPEKIEAMLAWIYDEMVKRAQLLKKYDVNHVDKIPNKEERPNTLMIFIDEFLMLVEEEGIKTLLLKICSAGRKTRVFVVLACMTPHMDNVGKLRHNVVLRFSFRQNTESNSRIALGDGMNEAAHITEGDEGKGRGFLVFDGVHEVQVPFLDRDSLSGNKGVEQWLKHLIEKKPPEENLIVIDRTEEKPKKSKRKKKEEPTFESTFME